MQLAQEHLPQVRIQELVEQIMVSRKITRINQQQLMSALLSKDGLDEQDRGLIDKVFNSVRIGSVRVVE